MALKDSVERAGRATAVERHGGHQAPARRRASTTSWFPSSKARTTRGARSRRRVIRRRRARRLGVPAQQSLRHRAGLLQDRQRQHRGHGADRKPQPARPLQRASRRSTASIGLFIGPSDLAAAFGHLGNANHPEVQEAMASVFAAAKAAGKPMGILAPVEADARRYMEMGATFVAVGSDLGCSADGHAGALDKFRGPDAVPIRLNTELPAGAQSVKIGFIGLGIMGIADGGQPRSRLATQVFLSSVPSVPPRWSTRAARPARAARKSRRTPTSSSRWCRIRRTSTPRCSATTAWPRA